jgi:hypothetical protein
MMSEINIGLLRNQALVLGGGRQAYGGDLVRVKKFLV